VDLMVGLTVDRLEGLRVDRLVGPKVGRLVGLRVVDLGLEFPQVQEQVQVLKGEVGVLLLN
jgi:hypothetical protein